eukprot:scaffold99808_cov30-Tisochrysis_lutea.AAC.1
MTVGRSPDILRVMVMLRTNTKHHSSNHVTLDAIYATCNVLHFDLSEDQKWKWQVANHRRNAQRRR